ncbi:hypothetical protein AOXY_G35746, partial [Acipenser oxyrinchus oxyrinchus]
SPQAPLRAAVLKLKKDIRRCHRMSRRPLPRHDLLSSGSNSGSSPPEPGRPQLLRPPVSPFSETVRILNRKVKPREPKRGRIILNLKVIDKGTGASNNNNNNNGSGHGNAPPSGTIRRNPPGRPRIPSRNRVIGKNKKFGEAGVPMRAPAHMKFAGFSLYGKQQNLSGPPPSSPQTTGPRSGLHHRSSSSSSSSSSSDEDDVESRVLDLSVPPESSTATPVNKETRNDDGGDDDDDEDFEGVKGGRSSPLLSLASNLARIGPEMSPCCASVVVTGVTTNLFTVTIKEFCNAQDFVRQTVSEMTPVQTARVGS